MLILLNTGQTNRISEKRYSGTLFSSGEDTLTKNLELFFFTYFERQTGFLIRF